jgi:hypothetical protein
MVRLSKAWLQFRRLMFLVYRTIVGAESKSYTFWIPPHIEKLTCPVTPFPTLNKLVPPGQAADSGLAVDKRYVGTFTSLAELPLATL